MTAKTQKLEVNVEEATNITSTGAYCKTDKPLPLLSKVALTLLVPHTNRRIECKGTVVRIHPVVADGVTQSYDVAIYFDEMNENDKEALSNYIEGSLSGKRRE